LACHGLREDQLIMKATKGETNNDEFMVQFSQCCLTISMG